MVSGLVSKDDRDEEKDCIHIEMRPRLDGDMNGRKDRYYKQACHSPVLRFFNLRYWGLRAEGRNHCIYMRGKETCALQLEMNHRKAI